MIAGQQHRRDRSTFTHVWTRVVRVIKQAIDERFLDHRLRVVQHAGQLPHHGVDQARRDAGVTEVRFRRGMRCGVWGGLKNDFMLGAWLGRFVTRVTGGTGRNACATCRGDPARVRRVGGPHVRGRADGYWKARSVERGDQILRTMWREDRFGG